MRKKLLSILLVLSLMLALVPAAFAADAVRTELESDGTTLAFYGSGVATADCWNGDWTAVTHVDLGYEIRGVAENVLARCVNLVSFEAIGSRYLRTYNGGLISIDGRQMLAAPNRCTAYEILDLVQTVKTGAFRYCQGLTAVTFPASLTTIEAQAFTSCLSLTDVQLPDGLKTIQFCNKAGNKRRLIEEKRKTLAQACRNDTEKRKNCIDIPHENVTILSQNALEISSIL